MERREFFKTILAGLLLMVPMVDAKAKKKIPTYPGWEEMRRYQPEAYHDWNNGKKPDPKYDIRWEPDTQYGHELHAVWNNGCYYAAYTYNHVEGWVEILPCHTDEHGEIIEHEPPEWYAALAKEIVEE